MSTVVRSGLEVDSINFHGEKTYKHFLRQKETSNLNTRIIFFQKLKQQIFCTTHSEELKTNYKD